MCYLVAVVLFGVVRGSHHDTSAQTQVGNSERLQERKMSLFQSTMRSYYMYNIQHVNSDNNVNNQQTKINIH